MRIKKEIIILGVIILLAVIIRVWVWHSFWNPLAWDEAAHSLGGLMLARAVTNGFSLTFINNFIGHYWATGGSLFFYPYGYTIMSFISFLCFGFSELAARLPAMIFSVLIIIITHLLAAKLFNKKTGLVAAFIAAINPWFIIWGGQALTDLPMAFLMISAIYFCLQGIENNKTGSWILSGICAGLAGMMKPAGFIIFPFLIFLLIFIKGIRPAKKAIWYITAIVIICAGSYFGLGIITAFILPKLKIMDPAIGAMIFQNIFHWFGGALTYAESVDPGYATLSGWLYYIKLLPKQLGGYPILFLAIAGVIIMWFWKNIKNTSSDQSAWTNKKIFWLIITFILYIYLIFTFLPNKDTRYTMAYIPFFCILAAFGITKILSIIPPNKKIIFILIPLTLLSTIQLNYFIKTNQPSMDIRGAMQSIKNSAPGLVAPAVESNGLNVLNISLYLSAIDNKIDYQVYWPEKINQADYIVAGHTYEVSTTNTSLIFDSKNIYVFKIIR